MMNGRQWECFRFGEVLRLKSNTASGTCQSVGRKFRVAVRTFFHDCSPYSLELVLDLKISQRLSVARVSEF